MAAAAPDRNRDQRELMGEVVDNVVDNALNVAQTYEEEAANMPREPPNADDRTPGFVPVPLPGTVSRFGVMPSRLLDVVLTISWVDYVVSTFVEFHHGIMQHSGGVVPLFYRFMIYLGTYVSEQSTQAYYNVMKISRNHLPESINQRVVSCDEKVRTGLTQVDEKLAARLTDWLQWSRNFQDEYVVKYRKRVYDLGQALSPYRIWEKVWVPTFRAPRRRNID